MRRARELSEIAADLLALVKATGVEQITLSVDENGDSDVSIYDGDGTRGTDRNAWADNVSEGKWTLTRGSADLLDKVLGRGEYQP